MEKRRIKKLISRGIIGALVLALVIPQIVRAFNTGSDLPAAVSAQVTKTTIESTLAGGGSLSAPIVDKIELPYGVELTKYLVENGELVLSGQAVAELDRVSVMNAISQVQDSLQLINERLESAKSGAVKRVTAPSAGKVKAVYISAGDNVRDAMLSHGALAIISLDGLMALELEDVPQLLTGDRLIAVLESGREESARVSSVLNGKAVITISDESAQIDELVTVYDLEGNVVGEGRAYVHSPLRITAVDGKVSSVNLKVERNINEGALMFTLEDAGSAELTELGNKHRQYEELMKELFIMYQSGTLNSPCDGFVSDIQKSLVTENADKTANGLANAPGEDADAEYLNQLGIVTAVGENGTLTVKLELMPTLIPDYSDLSALELNADNMVFETQLEQTETYIYLNNRWEDYGPARAGDYFVFSYDEEKVVWMIYAGHNESFDTKKDGESDGEKPSDIPGGIDLSGIDLSGFGIPAGNYGDWSGATEPEDDGLYSLDGSVAMNVKSATSMELHFTADEHDILRYRTGMSARFYIDALSGREFNGTVTELGSSGTNSDGSSKYQVTVSLEREAGILEGMSASVIIEDSSTTDIAIPVAALNDSGSKCFVYTAYEQKGDLLTMPVEVTTGVSDGINVQILSGLTEGQTVWYRYQG